LLKKKKKLHSRGSLSLISLLPTSSKQQRVTQKREIEREREREPEKRKRGSLKQDDRRP
jgi:hypothetical protein